MHVTTVREQAQYSPYCLHTNVKKQGEMSGVSLFFDADSDKDVICLDFPRKTEKLTV